MTQNNLQKFKRSSTQQLLAQSQIIKEYNANLTDLVGTFNQLDDDQVEIVPIDEEVEFIKSRVYDPEEKDKLAPLPPSDDDNEIDKNDYDEDEVRDA